MNELLEDFAAKAQLEAEWATPQGLEWFGAFKQRYAELIIQECMAIARNWEDQLERYKMSSEADAVGIATYRIARQFGVKEE